MQAVLVVHYDEVGLKKGNRRFFMDRLVESMKRVVKTVGRAEIRRLRGQRSLLPWHTPFCEQIRVG